MAHLRDFEDYFRRADLDKDGRISGQEAVAFFQGANLPQVTLAKIWQFADQGQSGYLTKLQFYNALKLVTVAQTGRDLTSDIVRAALAGPAAAQIPAPRIVTPVPSTPSYGAPSVASQAPGYASQYPSAAAAPQSRWSSQPSASPVNAAQVTSQAVPRPGSASGVRPGFAQDTWPSIKSSGSAATHLSTPQAQTSAAAPAQTFQVSANPSLPSQVPVRKDAFGGFGYEAGKLSNGGDASKIASNTGGKPSLSDAFGGDPFAASNKTLSVSTQKPSSATSTSQGFADFGDGGFRANPVATAALVPTDVASRSVGRDSLPVPTAPIPRPVMAAPPASGGQGFPTQPAPVVGMGIPWPRMTESDAQRYTRVFAEVDTDRDGKITGEQARDLFLSWGLPREVLKQVWDLSDQDGDSMLSLREFCTALYLMERFREGRPLPPVLPTGFHYDDRQPEAWSNVAASRIEQARATISQHSAGYNVPSWQQNPGILQSTGLGSASVSRPGLPTGLDRRMPVQGAGVEAGQPNVYKSKAPVLELHLVNQLSRDEQETLKTKHKAAEEADKKTFELDKEIMDYREKAEFYRIKLQEIILFKSRCDNKLSEITERAAADKREMEALAKKYDERFKAAGEVNSRLQAEEAVFRDIQERKLELYNAIAKMEQGGDANGLLQIKADRISMDLDELKKALNERARRLGLRVKETAPTEQQFGWQTGLQENAAEWDEDWDKFDDEGFVAVQDFMENSTGAPPPVSTPVLSLGWESNSPFEGGVDSVSSPRSDRKDGDQSEDSPPRAAASELASPPAESETSGRSGLDSPTTSSSLAAGRISFDKSGSANKASQRYANVAESNDFGGDVFNNPTSFSSTTNSFEQGPPSFNSVSDTFGDGAASWSAAFSHDEEVDSGMRASWGFQSYPSSTQASLDVTGNRTSRFGRTSTTSQGFADSLDYGSSGVASPGRVTDGLSSPAQSHRSNGNFNFRDSEDLDAFGSPSASKDFDRSPRFFGGSNTMRGSSVFDSPRAKFGAGNEARFTRFDSFSPQNNPASFSSPQNNPASFSSPQNNPAFPGSAYGEDRHENNHLHAGNDRTFNRFDSFGSVKSDAGRGRSGVFTSFDEGDDLFAGTGPFNAGNQEKKPSDLGWSNF
ncbi:epidermal growth factor receptor substrate 15 [Marchantia polymorpha subsp. ruderalis]